MLEQPAELGRRLDHLLEVVEQQQKFALANVLSADRPDRPDRPDRAEVMVGIVPVKPITTSSAAAAQQGLLRDAPETLYWALSRARERRRSIGLCCPRDLQLRQRASSGGHRCVCH